MTQKPKLHGAGLGFRRELLPQMSLDDVDLCCQQRRKTFGRFHQAA